MICEQNQSLSYWKVLDTGQTFKNRKEAKEVLGHYYFNKLYKDGQIKFYISDRD